MAEPQPNQTLPATARKLEKARTEGQVVRSRDLSHFAALGLGLMALGAMAPQFAAWLMRVLQEGLRFGLSDVTAPARMGERLSALSANLLVALAAVGGIAMLLAVAAALASGGWNFTLKPLAPQWGKLNPLAGLGRMVSLSQLTETVKASVLALGLAVLAAVVITLGWRAAASMLVMPLPQALAAAGHWLRDGLWGLALMLAVFAAVDVPLQRQLHARRLRMSVDEVKREMRESEGSPEIKGQRRARMRELASRRMLAEVPKADLVVMNPTHYAVALKYDEQRMAAPRVVAKGSDLVALRIRDIAREAHVPVLQAPPLARALYAHTEVDQEVPARLFSAVAQVLAWVYQLRDAVAAGRRFPADAPQPEVPADMDPLSELSEMPTPAALRARARQARQGPEA